MIGHNLFEDALVLFLDIRQVVQNDLTKYATHTLQILIVQQRFATSCLTQIRAFDDALDEFGPFRQYCALVLAYKHVPHIDNHIPMFSYNERWLLRNEKHSTYFEFTIIFIFLNPNDIEDRI